MIFHCQADAQKELGKLSKKWKYHLPDQISLPVLNGKRVRSGKDELPAEQRFRIHARLKTNTKL